MVQLDGGTFVWLECTIPRNGRCQGSISIVSYVWSLGGEGGYWEKASHMLAKSSRKKDPKSDIGNVVMVH